MAKTCLVCGNPYDPAVNSRCTVAFGGRHIPTDRLGTVYILCFGSPTKVANADVDTTKRGLVTHYVGWTGQRDPDRRVSQHEVPLSSIVKKMRGTAEDEHRVRQTENCPRCGQRLSAEGAG